MRTIIAGSRTISDYSSVLTAIKQSGFIVTAIVSGGARGVDSLGQRYARENLLPLEIVLPNWNEYGFVAGFLRNEEMASMADALIAVWDGKSRGTAYMIGVARRVGLPVYVHFV